MQVRCSRCQSVFSVDPGQPRAFCSNCGLEHANPYYGAPSGAATPPTAAPPGYAPPGWGAPAPPPAGPHPEAKGAESSALTWGIVSLVGGLLFFPALFLGFVAISYGKRANQLGGNGQTGLVLGWISVIIGFVIVGFILLLLLFFASLLGALVDLVPA